MKKHERERKARNRDNSRNERSVIIACCEYFLKLNADKEENSSEIGPIASKREMQLFNERRVRGDESNVAAKQIAAAVVQQCSEDCIELEQKLVAEIEQNSEEAVEKEIATGA